METDRNRNRDAQTETETEAEIDTEKDRQTDRNGLTSDKRYYSKNRRTHRQLIPLRQKEISIVPAVSDHHTCGAEERYRVRQPFRPTALRHSLSLPDAASLA